MAVSNVELRVDARQAVNALRDAMRASTQAESATQKLKSAFATAGQVQATFGAKVANTETAIRRQIAALRDVQSKVQIGGRIYQKAAGQIAEYEARLRATNSTQDKLKVSSANLIGAMGGLAAAYGQLRAAQQLVQTGIQREESTRRLTFLARGYGEIALAQQAAARTGRQFGLSITESNQQFAQLYGRLRPLGVSLKDIETTFVGFNTAAKLSGTTAAESAGALVQLAQALSSGALRGQELNSILDQAPGLTAALIKELNVPPGQLKELGEQGKITADIVIRALQRAGSEGAGQLAEAMKGPAQQVKNLQNEFQNLQAEVAQVVMPAVINAVQRITDALKTAIQYVQDYKEGWELISTAVGNLISPFQGVLNVLGQIDARMRSIFQNPALAMLLSLAPGGAIAPVLNAPAQIGAARRQARQGAYVSRFAGARDEAFARARMIGEAVPAGAPPAAAAGGGRAGSNGRAKASDAERAAKAAADELARVNGIVRERKAETEVMMLREGMADRISAAEAAGDRALQIRLQGEQRALDIQYKYAQELARENDIRAQRAIIDQGIAELYINQNQTQRELAEFQRQADQDRLNALQKAIELQYEQNTAIQQQKQLADSVATTIGQGMTSAFDALINGAQSWEKSLQQIASGVLVDIANQLIRIYVIEQAINAIKSFLSPAGPPKLIPGAPAPPPAAPLPPLPARAMGGSVTGGKPYLVGEKGPELFMPGRSGGIAPTGSFGGGVSVVVNVDASGTSVQGNEPDAAQLGRAVSVAVQAEIIKQQRPGGLLAATRR